MSRSKTAAIPLKELLTLAIFGLRTIFHLEPSQCSIRIRPEFSSSVECSPTVHMLFEDIAATAYNTSNLTAFDCGSGLGMSTDAHLVPFHRTDTGSLPKPPVSPTAHTSSVERT